MTNTTNARGKRGREKLLVDKDEFQTVVNELEENTTFEKIGDLWKAVERTEWAKGLSPRPLTAAVANQRATELGITYKTKGSSQGRGRGRAKLVVDKDELQKVVNEVESKQVFTRIGDLWKAIEATDWAKNLSPRPLTAVVAAQRVEELNIETKTQPARKRRRSSESSGNGEPKVEAERPMPENIGVPSIPGMLFVITPAGECPHKLTYTDPDTVKDWCSKVVKSTATKRYQLAPSGLTYFARQFYDIFSDEYATVKENILACKHEIYGDI